MRRWLVFVYGVVCYAAFFVTFLYALGWVGGFLVPTALDGAPSRPRGVALAIDAGLLLLFALQHSVMARPGFKRWWTRFVPEPAERSTYVLFSSVALALLFALWEPLGGTVWDVSFQAGRVVLWGLFAAGWGLVFVATLLINHFDLFGLRQVWLYLRGRPYTFLPFKTPGLYRVVRHPLYVGWLLAFWGTPTMTASHLFLAFGMTAYILVAIRFEERDLLAHFGEDYAAYRGRVGMLVPKPSSRRRAAAAASAGVVLLAAAVIGCGRPAAVPREVLLDGVELNAGMSPAEVIELVGPPDVDRSSTSPPLRISDGEMAVGVGVPSTVREFGYRSERDAHFRLRLVFEDGRLVEWDHPASARSAGWP